MRGASDSTSQTETRTGPGHSGPTESQTSNWCGDGNPLCRYGPNKLGTSAEDSYSSDLGKCQPDSKVNGLILRKMPDYKVNADLKIDGLVPRQ